MNGYCQIPGCEKPVEGRTGMCASHNKAARKQVSTPIKKVGEKLMKNLSRYHERVRVFLINKRCAVHPHLKATEVHHMAGRTGDMLMNEKYWLPVSAPGHVKIEMNPHWAKMMGFSVSRLTKKDEPTI